MIKNFKEFLNENSSWHATFKAQGDYINKKDLVTTEELEQIAYYFKEFYKMDNIKVGELDYGLYGVSGDVSNHLKAYFESFRYYWKSSEDPELEDIESGWVGNAFKHDKTVGHFMSPFQFLECVEKDYFFLNAWGENISKQHLSEMESVMGKLAMKSKRRGTIIGRKFGL
jgi:hypothetical protein